MKARSTLALALAASAAGLALAPAGGAQQFTRDEVRELERGEPVRRPRTQQRAGQSFVGGTAWRVIPRPIAEVWRGVEDADHLCDMLPQCVEQRVLSRADARRTLRFTHEYGPIRASYHVRVELRPDARDVSFRLDRSRPNDVRDAWGFLELAPYRGELDRTLVTWGVMADPGSRIMTGVLGGAVQASLLRVPDEMYDYLMGPARARYRD
ncbi:MAG: hypothetical protein KF729_05455 [Sandaracinaceae bacterium]|nr:hypothetical protein [Sandaracinaceae bacterium]